MIICFLHTYVGNRQLFNLPKHHQLNMHAYLDVCMHQASDDTLPNTGVGNRQLSDLPEHDHLRDMRQHRHHGDGQLQHH
jgi:hypothetical protein